jgi:hypothetical protein
MAYSQSTTVRLERQPHRDAVIRMREAYRRLLRSQRPSVNMAQSAAGRPASAQEVQA